MPKVVVAIYILLCYNKISKYRNYLKVRKVMKKVLIIFGCILLCIGLALGGLSVANRINEGEIHKYIDSFSAVEYENQLTPQYDENGVAYFVTDDNFKVLHLTDIHIGGGCLSAKFDKMAINAVAAMVSAEKPDLVVISGDMAATYPHAGTLNNRYSHEIICHMMEQLGVYWTVNFGNHDSEIYNTLSRSEVADIYEDENLKFCLFDRGPADIYGESNHVINVRNTKGLITKSIFVMDSNSYTDEDPLGLQWIYDNIHQDQIDWYENTVKSLNQYNADLLASMPENERPENIDDFTAVQSLLFIHIPLMEVRRAYDEYLEAGDDTENVKYLSGKMGESAPYVYCSLEEEEMFETILALNSTKAIFFGHDHLNNAVMDYKGVLFSYGFSVDYFAYAGIHKMGSQRGCTVINCSPDTSFEIIHENYYQDKYVPLYEKEVVDLTN